MSARALLRLTIRSLSTLALATLVALAAALSPITAAPASADLGGFVIRDYHTELTVESDAGLLVEETIIVEFSERRHGIYRTIPIRYTDPRGFEYGLRFRLLSVEDGDGRSHGTAVSREGRNISIRIGDADRMVIGEITYIIRYHIEGAVTHLDTHDELYWNAIGAEWATTIQQASAVVHLPGELRADEVEAAAYAGPFASSADDVSIQHPEPDTLIFASPRALDSYEAMTVVAAWPHGYVEFPSAAEVWLRRILSNWVLVLPFVALAWVARRYRTLGRDPEGGGSIAVRYEAPEGVGPGEIGTLVDEKVDMRDITATVVDLAVKGFMRIEVEEKKGIFTISEETTFVRIVPAGDSRLEVLLPHERKVLDGIFKRGERIGTDDLKEKFYQELPDIKSALYRHLADEDFFAGRPDSVRTKFAVLVAMLALGVLGIGLATAFLTGAIFPYAAIIPVAAAILTAVFVSPFVPAMPRRTEKGVRTRDWALGFEEFVDRVESDRLERTEAITAFETLLPYAMALGVAATWAKKFEGIYEEGRSPGWYVGPHTGG
ncbi:MAG TPA: DUF2207 domain-containing protein, partial [Methylomirabilota bacterium]|nr:DUF2207 domain-containing protein [Methylomirabilota bacterium]